MRKGLTAAILACGLALAGCESTGYGYGANPPQTRLSQCMRNALIGAGIGAAIGAVTAPRKNRGENAALGAAAGGLSTYGVCRYLSAREQQRVENAYYQSLQSGSGVNENWQSDQGAPRALTVQDPAPAPGYGGQCRQVRATISDPQMGDQQLPPETFCRNASGQWIPA
jgi:surface antigen